MGLLATGLIPAAYGNGPRGKKRATGATATGRNGRLGYPGAFKASPYLAARSTASKTAPACAASSLVRKNNIALACAATALI